mmetsp:Transcript_20258/g.38087  ORF Transcript_20258/g.38087 Transcript_20258/m.38087 type:complete len:244 (-) Transcript_20258:242-973(-)
MVRGLSFPAWSVRGCGEVPSVQGCSISCISVKDPEEGIGLKPPWLKELTSRRTLVSPLVDKYGTFPPCVGPGTLFLRQLFLGLPLTPLPPRPSWTVGDKRGACCCCCHDDIGIEDGNKTVPLLSMLLALRVVSLVLLYRSALGTMARCSFLTLMLLFMLLLALMAAAESSCGTIPDDLALAILASSALRNRYRSSSLGFFFCDDDLSSPNKKRAVASPETDLIIRAPVSTTAPARDARPLSAH